MAFQAVIFEGYPTGKLNVICCQSGSWSLGLMAVERGTYFGRSWWSHREQGLEQSAKIHTPCGRVPPGRGNSRIVNRTSRVSRTILMKIGRSIGQKTSDANPGVGIWFPRTPKISWRGRHRGKPDRGKPGHSGENRDMHGSFSRPLKTPSRHKPGLGSTKVESLGRVPPG